MIKSLLEKVIPSYRIGKSILQELYLQNDICKSLVRKLENLDKKNEYLFWLSQRLVTETDIDTKKRIFLETPKAEGILREYQLFLLYILKRIKRICDDNNIAIWLSAGSLLGAVRHHGFIPWDDDIDLAMYRKDYTILKDLIDKDKELTIEHYYTYETSFRVVKVKLIGINSLFIDIFFRERIDASVYGKEETFRKTKVINELFHEKATEYFKCNKLLPSSQLYPVINRDIDAYFEKLYEECAYQIPFYGHGDYLCDALDDAISFRTMFQIISVDDFFPLKDYQFEDIIMKGPKNADLYLNTAYGDYYSFPSSVHPSHIDETLELYIKERSLIKKRILIDRKE